MTRLAIGGIAGFFLMGIAVLIIYFSYPVFEYSLAIGSILIIIGLVTVIQLKLANKLWKNNSTYNFVRLLSTWFIQTIFYKNFSIIRTIKIKMTVWSKGIILN